MIHDVVTSTVTIPTGTLAVLAQRLVKMGASPSTWVSPRAKVRRAVSADILQMFRASCRPALETARKALRLECDHRSDRSRERDERPVDRCEIRSSRKTRCKPLLLIIDDLVLQAGDRQLFATIFGLA